MLLGFGHGPCTLQSQQASARPTAWRNFCIVSNQNTDAAPISQNVHRSMLGELVLCDICLTRLQVFCFVLSTHMIMSGKKEGLN